jgi:pyruvate carboxylase
MKSLTVKGGDIVRYLPTPVYLYGMVPGQSFSVSLPQNLLDSPSEPMNFISASSCSADADGMCVVTVKLERISSLKNGSRDFIFSVNGAKQVAVVKDTCNTFVFEGPMADAGNSNEIAR